MRFGERLQVQWTLDPAANTAKLPPLLLQPLVENAVRHGVEPGADGASIHIRTQRQTNKVVVEISNTLPNSPSTQANPSSQTPQGHGITLDNDSDRLRLLHDLETGFQAGVETGFVRRPY